MTQKKGIAETGKKSIQDLKDLFNEKLFSDKKSSFWADTKKNIVIIGSGIGGLASGALFAEAGHNVTILEMNETQIGGHGRWLTIQGMKYSMGPQYVWEFNDGEQGDQFLEHLGIKSSNPFLLMERDGFERVFIGHNNNEANSFFLNFKIPLGLENFRNKLTDFFPEERDNLNNLFSDMIGIYNTFKSFYSSKLDGDGKILLMTKFMLSGDSNFSLKLKLTQTVFLSLKEWFDQYNISSLPRRILYSHGGIFAESESEMAAIAYIIGTGNYHKGARYPEKGFNHFFESLVSSITSHGGSVTTGKKVIKIETENNIAKKVLCSDGTEYPCDVVFSDISPKLTYLLMERDISHFDYLPSHCIPTICIGLKSGLGSIAPMKGRNYWWQYGNEVKYDNPDVTAPPQMLFICSPTANSFGAADGEHTDALVVYCAGNYQQEKEIYEKGDDAVKKYKDTLSADIMDILDQNVFPGIKEKLLFTEVVSSIDIERQTNGEMGNAYGRRLNVKELLKGQIEEKNCPANLYNVSATKNNAGIAGGIATALQLLEDLTGKKMAG